MDGLVFKHFDCLMFLMFPSSFLLTHFAMHTKSVKTRVFRVTMVVVNAQLNHVPSFTCLRLRQIECLNRVSGSWVGKVEERRDGLGVGSDTREWHVRWSRVNVSVRGQKVWNMLNGHCCDVYFGRQLDHYNTMTAPESPALAWRCARL